MKKYFIASVVAVMAFAFAAFAASLTVTSTVVQAGETQTGFDCVDNAEVIGWTYAASTGLVNGVTVELSNEPVGEDPPSDHTCAGKTLHVTVLEGGASLGSGSETLGTGTQYTVSLSGVSAAAIDGVRIGIVQE